MTYAPVVPMGGAAGWAFLSRTREAQQAAHAQSAAVARETERFAERIGEVRSAADLVGDRELLKVALGAFGLSGDLGNAFFVRRVLEEGAEGRGALANRLADRRYADLARAFAFEDPDAGLVRGLVEDVRPAGLAEFEAARDGDRERHLELIVRRQLAAIGASAVRAVEDTAEADGTDADGEATELRVSDDVLWLSMLTPPATRAVLTRGLDLPDGFEALRVGDKVEALRTAAETRWGPDALRLLTEPGPTDPDVVGEVLGSFHASLLPPMAREGFAEGIVARYEARGFEEAVGEQAPDMRLVLNLQRELPELARRDVSEDTRWFTIMGTPPLRQVFETAFGLPTSFGTLDVDRQLEVFKDKAARAFGEEGVARFAEPEALDELTRLFLARSQIAEGTAALSSTSIALTLLSGGG